MEIKELKESKTYLLKVHSNIPADDLLNVITQLETITKGKVICIYDDMKLESLTKREFNFLKRMLKKRRWYKKK